MTPADQSQIASVRMRWQNLDGTAKQRVAALKVEGWDEGDIKAVVDATGDEYTLSQMEE